MEFERLVGILRRKALRIVLFATLVGVGVGVLSSQMPKTYEASTTLVVAGAMLGNPPQIDQIQAAARMAQTLAELATARPVLAAALRTIGDSSTPEAFRGQVDARAAPDSLFIIVTARADDATMSARLANAVASQLVIQAPELLGATSAAVTSPINTVETALPPSSPISPRVLLYTLLAIVAAVLLAVVVAIVADYRRHPATADPVVAAPVPTVTRYVPTPAFSYSQPVTAPPIGGPPQAVGAPPSAVPAAAWPDAAPKGPPTTNRARRVRGRKI